MEYDLDTFCAVNSLNEKQKIKLSAVLFMIDNDTSIRQASKNCMIPKSTIHSFIHKDLAYIDLDLYDEVIVLLKKNKKEVNNFRRFPRPEPMFHHANIVGSNWR